MSRWLTSASIDPAAGEAARPAHDHHHADAAVVQGRLGAGEGEAVVGRADDQRVVRQAEVVEGVEDGADALVERAGAGLEGGHVLAGRRRVGQVGRRQRVERVADRGRRRKSRWVSKKPTDMKKGSGGGSRSASIAIGAMSSAWWLSTSITSS